MDTPNDALIAAFSTVLVPEDGIVDDYYLPIAREGALAASAQDAPRLEA